jgi:cell division protein ZapE
MPKLFEIYLGKVESGGYASDSEQKKAVQALQRLAEDLAKKRGLFAKKKPVKGVYIHGGVGRGKSMLMDLFFANLPDGIKKRRVHFHAFMIETQDWLHRQRLDRAPDSVFESYAKHVANTVRVLCFDEFHVTDVADAMILSRLFTALFDYGVAVVATSNWPPDRLYEGGLQRERFLPFIELVKERMQIVHLDSDTDYRGEAVQDLETYLYPLNPQTQMKADGFFHLLSGDAPVHVDTITVKGRDIPVRAAGGVARFTFQQLCEQPHGAEDYLTIADKYHTVFVEGIPRMGYDRNNETKRLMTLVDVLYDARVRVFFTAESAPEKIYHDDKYAYEFERTISRLREMQSSSYLETR